jgi:hypothetical protein
VVVAATEAVVAVTEAAMVVATEAEAERVALPQVERLHKLQRPRRLLLLLQYPRQLQQLRRNRTGCSISKQTARIAQAQRLSTLSMARWKTSASPIGISLEPGW